MKTYATTFSALFLFAAVQQNGTAQTRPAERGVTAPDSVRIQERRVQRPPALKELRDDIDALLSAPEWSGAHVGVSVLSLEGGDVVYRKNDDRFFVPASLQKLFTTSTSLSSLGPEHRYKTSVHLDGQLHTNGEFVGNIVIRGGGDPTWSTSFGVDALSILDDWAETLDSMGIRSVKGNIIGDDDMFDDFVYAPGWSWDDLSWSYAPQVGALAIFDNSVSVHIVPPSVQGEPPVVQVSPETDYLRVVSSLRVLDSTGVTDITPIRDASSNVIELVGTLAVTGLRDTITLRLSVDNPTTYVLWHFRSALQRRGIRFRGAMLDIDDWTEAIPYDRTTVIAEYVSMPLKDMIKVINQRSHNLGAEMLIKAMGWQQGDGSWSRGTEVVRSILRRDGVLGNGMSIVDGSGLSRLNLCTPNHVTSLLARAYRSHWGSDFKASLAAPGQAGTLRRRMVGSRAEQTVRAKTGSMNFVSTIAGFVTSKDGEQLAYAIMIENYMVPIAMAQNMQDLICMRLASFSRRTSP